MKILYLAHRIPYPPNKGDKLRAFRQIEQLAEDHGVWCACFIDDPRDERYVRPLREICRDVVAVPIRPKRALLRGLTGLLTGGTVTESFYRSAAMRETLALWSGRVDFDIVVAFSSGVARHALSVPARRHVLDLCDLDSRKWADYSAASRAPLKWLYAREGLRLARCEVDWIDQFDASLLITKAEAESLDGLVPQGKIHIVGNGVDLPPMAVSRVAGTNFDLASFRSSAEERGTHQSRDRKGVETHRSRDRKGVETHRSSNQKEGGPGINQTYGPANTDQTIEPQEPGSVVGFVGVMDYKPNIDAVVWFVRRCWPGVRRVHPHATFRIIGRNPTRAVSRLGNEPGVRVVGEVESVQDELQRIDVSVAPLPIARGLQNKVLEAMACAKPVVLTRGAARGIDATDGEHFLIADAPQHTIQSVNRLLADPQERISMGQAARSFVSSNHSWQRELRSFEQIATGIMDNRTAECGVAVH